MNFNKSKKRKIIIFSIILILIILIIMTILLKKEKYIEVPMNLDFESRINELETTNILDLQKIGWIQVQGTNIDFPILTPMYYEKNMEIIGYNYSWQLEDNDNYNRKVIMGHNLINVSKEPLRDLDKLSRFEALMLFSYEDFATNNLYFKITNNDGTEKIYKIYAVTFQDEVSDKSDINYIDYVRNNSIYFYDVDVNENDELVSLITCTRYYGIDEKTKFVVDGRLVRDNEEILKYYVSKQKEL